MSKTAHELTRKEMKAPDRFQVVASEAASWMVKRQKQFWVAAMVIVAAVLVAAVISWVRDSKSEKSGELLYQALVASSGDVASADPQLQAKGLQDSDKPTYKTEQEKQQAVLAAAAKVQEGGAGGRAAITASLVEADAHLALRDWDKAIAAYQRFLSAAPKEDTLRFAALDGLARAEEGKGDLNAAARHFDEAGKIKSFHDRATLERARVLAKAGKKDEAKQALDTISKESMLQSEAQEQLKRLGAK
jgi:tetratricopeptide (TPR) repeat protein